MSLWRIGAESEPGLGEYAVDQMGSVLDLAQAAPDGSDQVIGVEERGVREFAPRQRPDPL